MYRIILVLFLISQIACQTSKLSKTEVHKLQLAVIYTRAGSNAENIRKVIKTLPKDQKDGALFLLTHMPEKDITSLSDEFISDQLKWAFTARDEISWCWALPDSIFYNEVLPYCNLDEYRDNWRPQFYNILGHWSRAAGTSIRP